MKRIGEHTTTVKFWKVENIEQVVTDLADPRKLNLKPAKGKTIQHNVLYRTCIYPRNGYYHYPLEVGGGATVELKLEDLLIICLSSRWIPISSMPYLTPQSQAVPFLPLSRLKRVSGLREDQRIKVPYWNQGDYVKLYTLNVKCSALFSIQLPEIWSKAYILQPGNWKNSSLRKLTAQQKWWKKNDVAYSPQNKPTDLSTLRPRS